MPNQILRINSSSLKEAVHAMKMVKPSSKDYIVRICGSNLHFMSKDARTKGFALVRGTLIDGDPEYISSDFYLSMDRVSILDYNGISITMNENNIGLNFKIETDNGVRQASVRKRNSNALRKPESFDTPEFNTEINSSNLEEMFRLVSCSAQIGETKTDQDMKINQVHFLQERNCLMANARTHATFVFSEDTVPSGLSIVSSDIPTIRSFLSRSERVMFGFDKLRFNLATCDFDRWISFSRVRSSLPTFSILDEDKYHKYFICEQEPLMQALNWAKTSVEGTSKLDIVLKNSCDKAELHGPVGLVSEFPIDSPISSDFTISVHLDRFLSMVRHSVGRKISIKHSHAIMPDMFEVSSSLEKISVRHFMQAMRG